MHITRLSKQEEGLFRGILETDYWEIIEKRYNEFSKTEASVLNS